MKELSIEEKARRYDEALKVIKECSPDENGFITIYPQEIFPELKKSKEEKIRKDIIKAFKVFKEKQAWVGHCLDDIDWDACIAWLKKNKYTEDDLDKAYKCADEVQYRRGYEDAKKEIEKQGKNNMGISEATKQKLEDNLNKALEKETPESWNEFLEKQGEQKSTILVEPKFEVGDWIIVHDKDPYQVKEINKYDYRLKHYLGGEMDYPFKYEESLRLWAIQDAKAGDVIYFNDGHGNDCIELIKSITSKKIEFWFCLTNGNSYEVFDGITPYTNLVSREDATPATKEQRALLFQKMKEAGYEWDAEKNELKKIEQNPTDNEMIEILHAEYEKGRADAIEEMQNLTWSEEDETMLKRVVDFIPQCMTAHGYNEYINWLKSLKERVQPQNRWKESLATADLENSLCDIQDGFSDTSYEYRILGEAIEFIRCTEPKPQWKPSDEQMVALQEAMNIVGILTITGSKINSLYQDLKKLSEE